MAVPVGAVTAACPDEDELLALGSGRADGEARTRVLAHLDDCAICRSVAAALVREASPGQPDEPRQIGRYRLGRLLGMGAMGIVHAAHDPALDREVALKVLRHDRLGRGGAERAARLVAEARALARLAHPHVVAVFDAGVHDDDVFIAMELVDGETLAAWSRAARAGHEVVALYLQAARGLAAAHATGLVHGDFKPDNVLVGRDGRARVGDFGLALAGPDDARGSGVFGTLAFMAPELLDGRSPSPRSDQFALAVALWSALAGARPFAGSSAAELAEAIRSGPPRSGPRPIAGRLRRVLARALDPDPARRWPDVPAMIDALAPFAHPPRGRLWLGAAGTALAALGVAWLLLGGDEPAACAPEPASWDAAARATLERRLAAIAPAQAAPLGASIDRELERYEAAWQAAHAEACTAEPAARLARLECLAQGRHAARVVIELLGRGDREVLERGPAMVQRLSPPARCVLAVEPPGDPRVLVLERVLAESEAYGVAGERLAAVRRAEHVLAAAETAGLPRLALRARIARGTWRRDLAGVDAARDDLRRAVELALAQQDDASLVDALVRAAVAATHAGRHDEAALLARLGEAAVGRLGGDPVREADTRHARCVAESAAGALGPSHAICTDARHAVLAVGGEADVRLRELDSQLGILAYRDGRTAAALEAFARNAAAYTAMFGAAHPAVDVMLDNQGWCLVDLGRAREAIPLLEAVIARRDWPDAWNALGIARRALGELDAAEAAHRRAIEAAVRRGFDGNRFEALGWLAELQLARGDTPGATRTLAEAASLATETAGPVERARYLWARARLSGCGAREAAEQIATAKALLEPLRDRNRLLEALRADLRAWTPCR